MSNVVSLAVDEGIAEITIDLPPVNAINYQIRAGLLETFQAAIADPEVKAIVLLCAGRTYMAGADINEFNTGVGEPAYHDVYRVMENSEKLIVTALHGTALGGGLEAALACHYRCATATARMGLPELSLGIIPGAGGSQRLPRLIGAKATVEMIFGIGPISTDKAMELGLLDRIIEGDLRDGAIAYARELLENGAGPRRCGEMKVDTKGYDDEFIADMKKLAAKRMRGQDAPARLLEAV
ncbi:MAG: enoyl-CoA hydratase/isomerase family protein, partial [Rhizobiales bacterium]|nr:enoyl-CoA hydratase/isomerase family protein [Hyphomicrobiales bacterium]